jgi:hypothetical protein
MLSISSCIWSAAPSLDLCCHRPTSQDESIYITIEVSSAGPSFMCPGEFQPVGGPGIAAAKNSIFSTAAAGTDWNSLKFH